MKTKFKIGDTVMYKNLAINDGVYIATIVAIRVNTYTKNEYIVSWNNECVYEHQLTKYIDPDNEEIWY